MPRTTPGGGSPRRRARSRFLRLVLAGSVAAGALASLSASGVANAASAPLGSQSNPLKIEANVAITTLDPAGSASVALLDVDSNLYSALTTIGPSLKLTGDLAKSWQQIAPNTWIFNLRAGAKFWNGDPLNAQAVVWNLTRVLTVSNNLSTRTYYKLVTSSSAVSPTEVQINTSSPDPNLARSLSFFYLLDPNWVPSHNPANDPMGSGPYRLLSYNPTGTIRLEANSSYYGTKPAFKYADYLVLTTDAGRVNALEDGEVNVSIVLDPADLSGLKKYQDLKVGAVPDTRLVYFKFNTLSGPLSNLDVREALNYGVNKAAITKSIFKGWVKPTGEILNPANTGYDPSIKPFPYDPTLAKKLLAEGGYPNGLTLTTDDATDAYIGEDNVVQAVAAQLSLIGVNLQINNLPFAQWGTLVNTEHQMTDLAYFGQAPQDDSSTVMLNFFNTSGGVFGYWSDPTYNSYANAVQSATSPQAIKSNIASAQAEIRAQAPILFLFNTPQTYAVSKGVNWKVRPDDWVRAYEMSPS